MSKQRERGPPAPAAPAAEDGHHTANPAGAGAGISVSHTRWPEARPSTSGDTGPAHASSGRYRVPFVRVGEGPDRPLPLRPAIADAEPRSQQDDVTVRR